MADPAQPARATALEVSVTVQGSKTVESTGQRELFTETTKTILVSESGAVLQMSAKVLPGQCVFLRNDQSGSEILCRVLESRQAGYTDLEFTSYNPKFWDAPEQPAAEVRQPAKQREFEVPSATTAQTPTSEEGPAAEEIPVAVLETSPAASANSSPETTEALPKQPSSAEQGDTKDPAPDWDAAKDAELLAVLASMDRDSKAHRESPAKERKKAKEAAPDTATADGSPEGKATADAVSETSDVSAAKRRIRGIRKFTARRDPISIAIVASILMVAVLGVGWRVWVGSRVYKNDQSMFAKSAQQAQPATQPAQSTASATATSVSADQAEPTQSAGAETPKPGAAAKQNPPLPAGEAGGTRTDKSVEGRATSGDAPSASASSDQPAAKHAARRKPGKMNAAEIIPAKIVSQEQPSVPPWAKGLDVDRVVQLNALIDEKGNLVEAKPISGPRLLQPAAQRAVALWVFEPALSDGKPIASHMLLTVQFQK